MRLSEALRNINSRLKEVLHLAVPAAFVPRKGGARWRNLGQPVLPYHYLRPVPVVVRETPRR